MEKRYGKTVSFLTDALTGVLKDDSYKMGNQQGREQESSQI